MLSRLLSFFNVDRPWDVTWAHRVNNRAELEKYCASDVMMIEGDILCSQSGEKIVMSHLAYDETDLILEDWLQAVLKAGKGAKLDFKKLRSNPGKPTQPSSAKIVSDTSRVLRRVWDPEVPLMLNADVLEGPNAAESDFTPLDLSVFISPYEQYRRRYNTNVILSLGLATKYEKDGEYTAEMVEGMLKTDRLHRGQVTFAVRARFAFNSWERVKRLLDDPRHTLTIWETKDASPELLSWMKRVPDPKKVFYDIADPADLSPITL